MKVIGRFVFFTAAFVLGIQSAALFLQIWPDIPEVTVNEKTEWLENEKASSPDGIQVLYAGAVPAKGDEITYLRFVVHNGTPKTIVYVSKAAKWPWPYVWINGRQVPQGYRCGSLAMLYEIPSGSSAEFRVGVNEFEKVPPKGALITVGYYLGEENVHSSEEILSEPFVLPDSFRQAIDSWNKEQELRWR